MSFLSETGPTEEVDADAWDGRCEWRIEYTRNGEHWTPIYDPVSHRPFSLSSLTWCVEKIASFKQRKYREKKVIVRIRNLMTGECIPMEALGL